MDARIEDRREESPAVGPGPAGDRSVAGRRRVVIEGIEPRVDGGRFPVKRTVGDAVEVEADIFVDGHDALAAVLRWRPPGGDWRERRMEPLGNDRWRGRFEVDRPGRWSCAVESWPDAFETWRRDFEKRVAAGQELSVQLEIGAELVDAAAGRATGKLAAGLEREARRLADARGAVGERVELALSDELAERVARAPDRRHSTVREPALEVVVDRERARFGAWYELFPRSWGPDREHGTFGDLEARLEYVAGMGFDVLYLPPIHPIGQTGRKGRDNRPEAEPGDVGSPWAIGASEGGHTAVHPKLGTLEDFRRLVGAAKGHGMEIALDIAFQCSPDHPWVEEHPEWFRWRPDRTVQFAENPPKKYEDIYPLDFETEAWRELWEALRDVFLFWIEQGVEIFRVDNPHTKPFAFWEWAIGEIKAEHPEVIFLSEAFTRPKVMYRLAKLGFTQSYTYFAWRNDRWGLTEYFTELTRGPAREFFRPNLWPNTPDILNEYLQTGGRPAFMARLVLAATLGASYGIYGPAFELCEATPREPGSEEYLRSEKYEIRDWHLDAPHSLRDLIARVNRIRRDNPALHRDRGLRFHPMENPEVIAYSKRSPDGGNRVLVVVNLDPRHTQSGWIELDLAALGLEPDEAFQAHDLLTDTRYLWKGPRSYVELDPDELPAHVMVIRRKVRTE